MGTKNVIASLLNVLKVVWFLIKEHLVSQNWKILLFQ